MTDETASAPLQPSPPRASLLRWAPLAVLALVMTVALAMGWHKYLTFKTVGLNYHALKAHIDQSLWQSLGVFALVYVTVTALSLPGAAIMTLTGGLLFGPIIGTCASVVAATVGASILFMIVNSSLGAALAAKAGPFVAKLRDGFRENALSYLLFLRLVPVFPFFIVNLVPALLGVPLSTFVIGTGLGIVPGSFAYTLAGAGLGSVIDAQNAIYNACVAAHPTDAAKACVYAIDFKALVTPELIYAGFALGIVALIPIALKYWSRRNATA